MLIGIVGYPDLDYYYKNINIRGCGKTLTMTYYLLESHIKEKRHILTNYHTKFSEYRKSADIVKEIFDGELTNIAVGLDEFQDILSSLGENKKKVKFYSKLINQSRKKNVDIYYCSPLFKDINNRIREKTNILLNPTKHHFTHEKCFKDTCPEKHYIKVNCYKPVQCTLKFLNPELVGKYYNTYEIVNEDDEI
jgi:hypothetical protein